MSFEIVFHFHEKKEEGGYNKEITKELKKRVGKNYEEVSLNSLASFILSQLARRDIFIYDYEVYEYKKQKLNCKETKDGIVIKGKKFTFDGKTVDFEEEIEYDDEVPPHNFVKKQKTLDRKVRKPLKHVMVDNTNDYALARFRGSGLKFTQNKEYAVYAEKQGNLLGSVHYLMIDDNENEDYYLSDFFIPAKIKYDKDVSSGPHQFDSKISEDGPKLSFENEGSYGMPDLRKYRK